MTDPHHIRRQVRDHVVALLVDGLSDRLPAADHVRKTRIRSLGDDELPSVLVYAAKEDSRQVNQDGDLGRALELVIDLRVQANDDIDDALDELAQAVETIMGQDRQVGGLALDDAILTGTEIGVMGGGEGVALNGSARLTYSIRLQTPHGQPQGG